MRGILRKEPHNGLYDTYSITSDGVAGGLVGVVDGGFVGEFVSGTFSGVNYSTCSVGCGDGGALGLFAGRGGDIPKIANTDCLYSAGAAFVKDAGGEYKAAEPRTETYLLTGAALPGGGGIAEELTFNYDSHYDGQSYPYLSRLGAHHGDWTVPETAGIFYWELENGEYNFYTFTWDGVKAAVEDGLCRKHACDRQVEDWGYGAFGMTGTNVDERTHALEALEKFKADRPAAEKAYTLAKNNERVEVVTGSGAKTLICDTRFGAAIEEKDNESALRREVRAFDQLEHVEGNGTLKFYQTHDIDAVGKARPALSLSSGGLYDGGLYRILRLNIGDGTGDAALFDAVEDATVKGVILYDPEGDGEIKGLNAAGIAAKLTGGTVDSCVVAGYTVSGTGNLGGLVAVADGDSAVMNSEATVALKSSGTSANIGGLVGSASGTLSVRRSYAGGSVDTGNGTSTVTVASVGGIVGGGSTVTYSDVYSYLDMTSAKGVAVYGIGPGSVAAGSRISEYWYAALPASEGSTNTPVETKDKDTAGIAGVTLAQLMTDTQRLGFSAEELYVPGDANGLTNKITLADSNDDRKFMKFPFAAFVTDTADGGRNIHYGGTPSSAYAGLFYYEKELITRLVNGGEVTETVYSYYAYGGEIYKEAMRGEKLLDGLCYDHHLNGERARIVESGYGYFYPDEGDMDYELKVGEGTKAVPANGEELGDGDAVKVNLARALSTKGKYRVFVLDESTAGEPFALQTWTLTAKNGSTEVGKTVMYVCPDFGGVITENKKIGRDDNGDKPENFIQIRTREQLETYLDASEHDAGINTNL